MAAFEAVIREVIPEAPGTVTLRLDPGAPSEYRAGQFLSIDPAKLPATQALAVELQERKGRRELPRAYSLASAPHEPLLAITVKEDPPGAFPALLSPYLCLDAKVGDVLPYTGFNGLYTLPRDLPEAAHVVHVCAGSGIVPNWGILKDALHRGLPARHTLLNSNRAWGEVIYRDQLTKLAAAHPARLEIVHALTRDVAHPEGVRVVPGRITETLLRETVPDFSNAWFYVCGPSIPTHERRAARARGEEAPPRFLECMRSLLQSLGVDRKRISAEGW